MVLKVYVSIIATLLFLSTGSIYHRHNYLSMDKISYVELSIQPNLKNEKIIFTKEKNYCEIMTLVALVNGSESYVEDRGTTHPIYLCVKLSDGSKVRIWGGSQHFQAVTFGNESYIFKSLPLSAYFKYLEIRYKARGL